MLVGRRALAVVGAAAVQLVLARPRVGLEDADHRLGRRLQRRLGKQRRGLAATAAVRFVAQESVVPPAAHPVRPELAHEVLLRPLGLLNHEEAGSGERTKVHAQIADAPAGPSA